MTHELLKLETIGPKACVQILERHSSSVSCEASLSGCALAGLGSEMGPSVYTNQTLTVQTSHCAPVCTALDLLHI